MLPLLSNRKASLFDVRTKLLSYFLSLSLFVRHRNGDSFVSFCVFPLLCWHRSFPSLDAITTQLRMYRVPRSSSALCWRERFLRRGTSITRTRDARAHESCREGKHTTADESLGESQYYIAESDVITVVGSWHSVVLLFLCCRCFISPLKKTFLNKGMIQRYGLRV